MVQSLQRIHFIGLGAIGLKYAARLHDVKPGCVRVIADAEREAALRADPPTVNGKRYGFNFVSPGDDSEPADLLFVAVKARQLPQALADMHSFVGPHTSVISLMNGITSEEILGQVLGFEHVLYANVYMDAVRQGHAVTYHHIGKIVFGERDNTHRSGRVQAIADLFDLAGIPYEIPVDMLRAHWAKFMLNVGINQASAVLRAPYGWFQHNAHARALMVSAAQEVVALSQSAGIGLEQEDLDRMLAIIDTLAPHAKTSMLQDIEAGRETEVDIFGGAVIDLGRHYGVPTPVNQTLFDMIKAMELARRQGEGSRQ